MAESELPLTRASRAKGRETGRQDAEEDVQASLGSRREGARSGAESHGRGPSRAVGELRRMTAVVGRKPRRPRGFKLGHLEERAPVTETRSPGQAGGCRERGELPLDVLALNSREGG